MTTAGEGFSIPGSICEFCGACYPTRNELFRHLPHCHRRPVKPSARGRPAQPSRPSGIYTMEQLREAHLDAATSGKRFEPPVHDPPPRFRQPYGSGSSTSWRYNEWDGHYGPPPSSSSSQPPPRSYYVGGGVPSSSSLPSTPRPQPPPQKPHFYVPVNVGASKTLTAAQPAPPTQSTRQPSPPSHAEPSANKDSAERLQASLDKLSQSVAALTETFDDWTNSLDQRDDAEPSDVSSSASGSSNDDHDQDDSGPDSDQNDAGPDSDQDDSVSDDDDDVVYDDEHGGIEVDDNVYQHEDGYEYGYNDDGEYFEYDWE